MPPRIRPALTAPLALSIGILSLWASRLQAQSPGDLEIARLQHFEKYIRPALVKYCLECHSNDTEASGGLVLDSKFGWETGGDSGPAIVPGQPDTSRLLRAIRYDDAKLQMPPDKKLPAEVVGAFEQWIANGAVDPRSTETSPAPSRESSNLEVAETHWSLQPITRPQVPATNDVTGLSPVDSFLYARLASAGIKPAPVAGRRDVIRRLYFDLTGLPPTPAVMQELLAAPDFDDAYRNLVDRLLASPAYGEAFARRWMDVARYAESVTLRGLVFPEAWRYRDYLVQAYCEDRPFDQMIREQIAGDLLQASDQQERWRQLVATSFLAMGNTNFEEQDKQQLDMDFVDEQLDVIGQAFLGQTISCARCHDHKFDPIPTRDYYALAGIFKSAVAMRHANVSSWIDQPLPLPAAEEEHFANLERELKDLGKDLTAKKKLATALAKKAEMAKATAATGAGSPLDQPSADPNPSASSPNDATSADPDPAALALEIKQLEDRQKELQAEVTQRPKYLTVVEENPPQDIPVHVRGDVHNLGDIVPRGFLSAIQLSNAPQIPAGASGRLQFAEWLTSPDHPLTARVYANRIWAWLMGQGLVDSPNNFGITGSSPSHPELLDWLATELIHSGWSTKHLVRTIVLSEAYRRQVAEPDERSRDLDPDNRLYWSGHRRRLSAEELRDAMLLASGELDLTLGGSLIKTGTTADNNYKHSSTRRSLYHPVFRNALPELYDTFDFAVSSVSTGQRTRSTVATQALTLMNEPWIHQRADALAKRIISETTLFEPEALIQAAYQHALQREPSEEELRICLEIFDPSDSATYSESVVRLAHALFASIDFRYLR